MEPILSIIIPVFNAEDRIEQCIKSVLNQSFKNLEILAINDGSTDNSLNILLDIQKDDSRLQVFNFENGGAALARQRGLEKAIGKYIGFVDSDDWIEPSMYATMIATIEVDKTDLVVCNSIKETENEIKNSLSITNSSINSKELLSRFIRFEYDYSVWNKLYKRETILDEHIGFLKELRLGQDLLFNLFIFSSIKCISIIPDSFYHYVSREGSLMSSKTSKRIASFNYIIKAFRQFCLERNKQQEWHIFEKQIGAAYQSYFFNLLLKNNETSSLKAKEYYQYLIEHLRLLDPLLLKVPLHDLRLFQRCKKYLLIKKQFRIFSILAALRHKTFI